MSQASGQPHSVAVVALPDVVAFDLAIPCQILGHREEGERYAVDVCAMRVGPVPTTTGFSIDARHDLRALDTAGTVIVPGFVGDTPPAAAAALRAAHARGARMVSICTGAFALAVAGLLDGRPATTHWRDATRLQDEHPAVRVDPGVLFVDDGDVLTSAGVAAGLDLCLHLVRRDHGAAHAHRIARRMVVAPQRDGGQAQFLPGPATDDGRGLATTRAWMLERLHEPLSVARMAGHAAYAERSFARRFRAETGLPPLRWLHAQRVLAARELLETTDAPIDQVAARCGFGTAASLREHFSRAMRQTPSAYRAAWLRAPGQG